MTAFKIYMAILLVVYGFAGCSKDDAPTETTASPVKVELVPTTVETNQNSDPDAVDNAALHTPSAFPVDGEWRALFYTQVVTSPGMGKRLNAESNRRLEACTRRKGFEFSVGMPSGPEIDYRIASNPLRTATLPMGYHIPPQPAFIGGTTEITPEMEIALDGGDIGPEETLPPYANPDDRPCNRSPEIEDLTTKTNIIYEQASTLTTNLSSTTIQYDTTPEAAKLTAEWSACMKERGYTYETPTDPVLEYSEAPTIEPIEIATRQADYECNLKVGLTQARSTWQRQAYETWLDKNAIAIAELNQARADLSEELLKLEGETP